MEKFKNIYRVPDYYKNFTCKCGECRSTCCQGWNITLDLNEYHRLIGMDCDAALRRRLDTAFAILDNPSPERYAVIKLNYFGHCSLLDEEGYCSLQRKCGEDSITTVCRQYPRSPKHIGGYECSCSNSCEAVIEALIKSTDPVGYEEIELGFDYELPKQEKPFCRDVMMHYTYEKLYDRSKSLNRRLAEIADMLYSIEKPFRAEDSEAVKSTLGGFCDRELYVSSDVATFSDALYLIERLAEFSPEMHTLYGELLNKYSCDKDDYETMYKIYMTQHSRLEEKFRDLEIWFEKILVNHLYYEGFQLPAQTKLPFAEAAALCALYALMKILASAFTGDEAPITDFVDVLAGLFRYAEHSSFDSIAASLMLGRGRNTPEKIAELATL